MNIEKYKKDMQKRNHRLWWQSSYDRGLDVLLKMWPEIKENIPDAELWISYGWNLFDKVTANNKERQAWKKDVEELMTQDGIKHFGRIGKDKLEELRSQCGIIAYPTYFTEISCISVLEAQNDGLVPVTMTLGALKETAKKGILIDGGIYKKEVKEKFKTELISLMKDDERWKKMSHKCEKFARKYSWRNIANSWVEQFVKDVD